MKHTGLAGLSVVFWLIGGCDVERSGTSNSPTASPIVRKHDFIKAAQPTKAIGEPCDVGGASECFSNLCVHTSPGGRLHEDHKCSQLCGPGRSPCPMGFICAQGHPSPDGMWCIAESKKEKKENKEEGQ